MNSEEAERQLAEAENEIANVIVEYEAMLRDEEMSSQTYAAIIGALYRLEHQPEVYVGGLSGPEFGGSAEAYKNNHVIPKAHLPLAVELATALSRRRVARLRIKEGR